MEEDLHIHLSLQGSLGGELSQQNTEIVPSNAIRVAVEYEPSPADGVINGKETLVFKVFDPRISGRVNAIHIAFPSLWG